MAKGKNLSQSDGPNRIPFSFGKGTIVAVSQALQRCLNLAPKSSPGMYHSIYNGMETMDHDIYKTTPPPVYEHNDATAENNSGKGPLYVVPGDVGGWSWGAFFWGLIWALFHRVYVVFWVLLPVVGALGYHRLGKPLTGLQQTGQIAVLLFCFLAVQVILGKKGCEWAWQRTRWDGVAHFKKVQWWWNVTGIALFVPLISFLLWVWASTAIENFNSQQQLRANLKAGLKAAEIVGIFIERHHHIPGSFAEAGVKNPLPEWVLDTRTARIRLVSERGTMKGYGVTLVPTFDMGGFVNWRCLADAPLRGFLRQECPWEGSEDARIFPARIQTANAVRFTDRVTSAVGGHIKQYGRLPATLKEAGMNSPLPEEISDLQISPGDGKITVTLNAAPMQGKAYLLVPLVDQHDNIVWQCLAHQIDWHYMPPLCRYRANPNYRPPTR